VRKKRAVPSWEPPQTILLRYTAKSCLFGVPAVSHFGRWAVLLLVISSSAFLRAFVVSGCPRGST
jgi:hypothetical protein